MNSYVMRKGGLRPHHCLPPLSELSPIFNKTAFSDSNHSCSNVVTFFCGEFGVHCEVIFNYCEIKFWGQDCIGDKENKCRVKIRQENADFKSKQQEKKLMETQWQLEMKPWSFLGHLSQSLISNLVTCI